MLGGQLATANAHVIENLIVTECLANVVGRPLLTRDNCLGALLGIQRFDKFQPFVLLLLTDFGSLEFSGLRFHRFRAHEDGAHHDLIAEHKIVDHHVVPVELPAPRLGCAGLTHDGDPVKPLAIFIEALRQFRQRTIELHDVLRLFESARA